MAEVDCSGWSWNSSDSSTPIRSGVQQLEQLGLLLEVGAGRVAEGVARAPVALVEQVLHVGGVVAGDAQLLADPLVPVLGQGLGHLDRDPVQLQVLAVAVVGEQLGRRLRGGQAHGDDVHADHVGLARGDRPEEVGDAQPPVAALAGEAEADPLAAVAVPDDHVVAVAVAGEVAVDDRRAQDLAGDGLVQQGPQAGPGLGLQGVAPGLLAAGRAQLPLAPEQRRLVQVRHQVARRGCP